MPCIFNKVKRRGRRARHEEARTTHTQSQGSKQGPTQQKIQPLVWMQGP